MERSLIQLSPSTAVVSLPAQWLQRNKLKKGAKLSVEEQENRLIIAAAATKSQRAITLDVSKHEGRMLWMIIDAVYTAGYDEITLQLKDAAQAALMTKVIHYYPGLIIEDERKLTMYLKDIANESEQDLDKLLSRVTNSLIATFEDALDAAQRKDWQTLATMKRRDYTINTYIALELRRLAKHGYTPFSQTGIMHTAIKLLEMFSDKLTKLLVAIGEKQAIERGEQKMLSDLASLFREVSKVRTKFSAQSVFAIEDRRTELLAIAKKLSGAVQLHTIELLELVFEIEELETALHLP